MTAARNLTAFFMASCTDDMTYQVRDFGMKMRLHMVQRLQADTAPDLFVKCANEHRVSQLHQETVQYPMLMSPSRSHTTSMLAHTASSTEPLHAIRNFSVASHAQVVPHKEYPHSSG